MKAKEVWRVGRGKKNEIVFHMVKGSINKTFLPFSCNFQILYVSLQKHLCTKL